MQIIGPFRHLPPVGAVLASLVLHAAAVATALGTSPTAPGPAVAPPALPVTIAMLPAATPAISELRGEAPPHPATSVAATTADESPLPRRLMPAPPSAAASSMLSPSPRLAESAALPNPARKPIPPTIEQAAQPALQASPQVAATEAATESPAAPPLSPAAMPGPDIAAASAATPSVPRFDGDGLTNPLPPYPRQARRLGQQGTVLLRVRVAADGRALAVEVLVSSGHEILDDAARDTVARWRFHPARQGSSEVEGTVEVPVVFRLTG